MKSAKGSNIIIVIAALIVTASMIYLYYYQSTRTPVVDEFKLVMDAIDRDNENKGHNNNEHWKAKFASILADSSKSEYAQAYHTTLSVTNDVISFADSLIRQFEPLEFKDYDVTTRVMIKQMKATELKQKIETARNELLALSVVGPEDSLEYKLPLTTEFNEKNAQRLSKPNWEAYHFDHVPAIAVKTLLEKYRGDALNAQGLVLEIIYKKATSQTK